MSGCDRHDCFDEAKASRDALAESSDRVGFYIFVRDDETGQGDYHWLGNSAFAGQAFEKLVELTLEGHVKGRCEFCDRTVDGLVAALGALTIVAGGRC
jgi:hypothetical protein